MKIEKIELRNFRSAKETVFNFTDHLNLFVGINGSGKSTVLEALSICLSWLVKRIERENGRGTHIPDSKLRIGEEEGFLDIHVTEMDTSFRDCSIVTGNTLFRSSHYEVSVLFVNDHKPVLPVAYQWQYAG